MKFDKCIGEIAALTGKELSSGEKKEVAKTVGELIEKFNVENKAGDLSEALMPLLDNYIKDLKTAALIEKRNAAFNVLKRAEAKNYLTNIWGDNLAQGIRSYFQGSLTPRQGSRNSLDVSVVNKKNQYKMGLTSRLAKEGVLDYAQSGKFDADIFKAMHELSKKVPDKNIIGKLPQEAIAVGKAINDSLEIARLEANKYGANIRKLEGRVLKRTHDPDKIGQAAGRDKPINDPAHKKAWTDFVSQRIDWDKSMPNLPEAKRAKALDDLYNRFVSGSHLDLEKMDGTPTGFRGATNVAKKMSQERSIHFKDAAMEYEYYKNFSRGDTLLGNAIKELDFDGTNVAVMQKMGPNAKANIDRVVEELLVDLRDSGRANEMKALRSEYDAISKSTWPIITNEINSVSLGTWGKLSTLSRKSQRASDLMMAAISATGDFLSVAGSSRYANNRSMGEYFNSLGKTITNVFGNFKKMTPEMMDFAKASSILLDTTMPTSASIFEADMRDPGALSKGLDWIFKFNGISALQDRIRLAAVLIQGEKYASYIGKSFDQLPVGTQSWFKQFDISPKEWDLMRGMELKEGSNGLKYLVVDTVNDIPLEKFDALESVQTRLKGIQEDKIKMEQDFKDFEQKESSFLSEKIKKIVDYKLERTDVIKRTEAKAKEDLEKLRLERKDMTATQIMAMQEKLNSRKEYTEARVALEKERSLLAETETDLQAYLSLSKDISTTEKNVKGIKSDKSKVRMSDLIANRFEKQGYKRQEIGEELGFKKGKIEKTISDMENKLKNLEKEMNKDISARLKTDDKTLYSKMFDIIDRTEKLYSKLDQQIDNRIDYLKTRSEKSNKILDWKKQALDRYESRISKLEGQARLKAREELRDKFGRSNHDLAAMSATEASAADQRILTWGGTRAGTPAGEIARHIMMYKSFMVTLMRKHLGREIYGYSEHRGSLSKMMLDSFTDKNKGGGFLAAMIPSSMALGYVNMTLKEMLKGKAPREPKDWKDVGAVAAASLAQSGSMGIYGDFLFGDMKSRFGRSAVETLFGPSAGRLGEVIDIAGSVKSLPFSDDISKDAEKTRNMVLNFGLNNTPGVSALKNHFATKLAFDYMITYNLHEMMNPGYLKKMEKKLKKEKQQEYLLPPSEVIQRGGGF